jgi:hypothetical protein
MLTTKRVGTLHRLLDLHAVDENGRRVEYDNNAIRMRQPNATAARCGVQSSKWVVTMQMSERNGICDIWYDFDHASIIFAAE